MTAIEETTKVLAFLGASLFFAYKLLSGFLIFNLSVGLKWIRKHKVGSKEDALVLTAVLKKGA
jgi:hypothetical protein